MRVAVTGGAGYIGSIVTEVLLDEGHDVIVLDNLSKGHADAVDPRARLLRVDIGQHADVQRALSAFAADAVVHMAADSLVGESVANPQKYYRNNMIKGLALLDAMLAARVRRMVFSSTAAVYGEPQRQPIEESDPTIPTNPYGATKLAFEQALVWYGRAYGLTSTSLRYFNAAGASARCGERHNPETHLIPLVLAAAAGRRRQVTVFGNDYPTADGTCVRDYVHVADIARAHVLALYQQQPEGMTVYNLGSGGGYSVRQVIDAALAVTRREIRIDVAERRPGDPAVLVASSERIGRDLGWAPEFTTLESIIASAWSWMQASGGAGIDLAMNRQGVGDYKTDR
jgi:UDP-glucose 4-epimerase